MVFGGDAALQRFEEASRIMKLDSLVLKHLFNWRPAAGVARAAKKFLDTIDTMGQIVTLSKR
jgi:hypothetical protein